MKSWIKYLNKYFSVFSLEQEMLVHRFNAFHLLTDTTKKLMFGETGSGTLPGVRSTLYLKRFFPCQLLRGRGRLFLQTDKHPGFRLKPKKKNPRIINLTFIRSQHEIKIDPVCFHNTWSWAKYDISQYPVSCYVKWVDFRKSYHNNYNYIMLV